MLKSIRARRGAAYSVLKSANVAALQLRQYLPAQRPLDNIFLPTVQKTGSQWLRAVLSDPLVRNRTRLRTYPQRRYEWGEFVKRFPRGTLVPGLYISYDLYEEIDKPPRYRTIYVTRDPRDVVVSWYWSMLESHVLMGKVSKYREALRRTDLDEGLHLCIDFLALKFAQMRTWGLNSDDAMVMRVRFEDLTGSPQESLERVFEFCDIDLGQGSIRELCTKYSKENMRRRDLNSRSEGEVSHYRSKRSRHADYFQPQHHEHFRRATGDLLELLGYGSAESG